MARANRHRGEVEVALAGETRVLRPSFHCLAEIEAATGRRLPELARRTAAGEIGARESAEIVAAGLRAAGKASVTPEAVGEAMLRDGLAGFAPPLLEFLTLALGGPGRGNRAAAGGTATRSRTAACSDWPAASSAGRPPPSGTARSSS